MGPTANQNNGIFKGLVILATAAVVFFLAYDFIVNRAIPFARIKLVEWNIVEPVLPEPVPPQPNVTDEYISVPLLSSPYTPSGSPFSDKNYELTPKIIFRGKFAKADLKISGDVQSSTPIFVMFNFGKIAGFLNAYRKSETQLDISKTKENGGLFDKIIDIKINLLGGQISTSGEDFRKTQSPNHFVYFLPDNEEIGTANLIAVPVKLSGEYGGGNISSMIIDYSCENSSPDCFISKCDGAAYSCILERFGKPTADQWLEKYKADSNNKVD